LPDLTLRGTRHFLLMRTSPGEFSFYAKSPMRSPRTDKSSNVGFSSVIEKLRHSVVIAYPRCADLGVSHGQALRNSLDIARHAERLMARSALSYNRE
jgi:hypothetical protein